MMIQTCCAEGCPDRARWRVILKLVPSREYMGRPWRFPTSLLVCDGHKDERRGDHYCPDEVWEEIVKEIEVGGRAAPYRPGTRADFELLPPDA